MWSRFHLEHDEYYYKNIIYIYKLLQCSIYRLRLQRRNKLQTLRIPKTSRYNASSTLEQLSREKFRESALCTYPPRMQLVFLYTRRDKCPHKLVFIYIQYMLYVSLCVALISTIVYINHNKLEIVFITTFVSTIIPKNKQVVGFGSILN